MSVQEYRDRELDKDSYSIYKLFLKKTRQNENISNFEIKIKMCQNLEYVSVFSLVGSYIG